MDMAAFGRAYRKQGEIVDKLVVVAHGNLDLVLKAIRVSALGKDKADLSDVLDYVLAHR